MKAATEILLSAAFVLTPPEHWTQNALARTSSGRRVYRNDPDAVSWCLVAVFGEIDATEDDMGAARRALIEVIADDSGLLSPFNNTHTHAEVLDALYRAAELSESGELQPSRGSDE